MRGRRKRRHRQQRSSGWEADSSELERGRRRQLGPHADRRDGMRRWRVRRVWIKMCEWKLVDCSS